MYNKLFTQILDSSIWLAPDPHRLVWITIIAAMDRNGEVRFACVENLAARARVSVQDTADAVKAFESADPHDPTQEFEGRRIERIAGGWFVLNAEKYRNLVTRAVANEQSKLRMQRKREKDRAVTQQLRPVTPSVSVSKHQNQRAITSPLSEKPQESAKAAQQSRKTMQTILDRNCGREG
jgi:hypothetical protein